MSLLTKYNLREHCRTCLKRLSSSAGITSTATNANEAPDNESFFNIYKDAELQQLICIYVDGQYKNETPSSSDHDFPENVCRVCFDKLHNFALFRRRAQQSAEKLRTVLNSNDSMIKVEIAYDENQQEQQQHKEVTPESREYDYRLKDALMNNEEVSAESTTESEENDDNIMYPFSPSAQSITEECSSSEEMAETEEDTKEAVSCTLGKRKKLNCTQCTQRLESHVREQQEQSQQAPQRKGLSLTNEHVLKAHEMFRNANRVSRPDKALILGFMAGMRENPRPNSENVIVIKLSETEEKMQQEDGSTALFLVESNIRLDYNTGEWKTFQNNRRLNQSTQGKGVDGTANSAIQAQNSVAI